MISGTSAGFGRRFAALIYDCVLLIASLMIYTDLVILCTRRTMLYEDVGAWVYLYHAGLLLVIGAYYVLNWRRSGQTLGMRAWRLRAVSDSGKPMTLQGALWRCLYGLIAWAPAGLGVLWLYVDPEHAALHDRWSRTRVVRLTRA